jgi:hypothetical protein
VDRNIRHFLWYGGVAGDGLRSVGEEALPSSKSVCSILPIAICGPGLYRAPAFTMPLVVLGSAFLTPLLAWQRFSYPTSCAALRFTPLKRCAGASVVRSCPSPVGRAQSKHKLNYLRVRRTGFSHRVGTSCPTWLRPFALPHPDKPCSYHQRERLLVPPRIRASYRRGHKKVSLTIIASGRA